MMNRIPVAALLLAAFASAPAAEPPKKQSYTNARTVYRDDGTHTESVQDLSIREQSEVTYNAQNVVVAKRKYLLNEQGLPLQGNIYDGRDELKARAQFLYDEFGRMTEQRMFNLQGEMFQRITFPFDSNGKPMTPRSQTFNVRSPDMKAGAIDFTNQRSAPKYDRSQGVVPESTPLQGNVPYLPVPMNQPGGGTSGSLAPIQSDMSGQDTNAQQGGKADGNKKGFFGRLFGGKKKEEKK